MKAEWLKLDRGGEISVAGGGEDGRKQIAFRISPDQSWGFYRTLQLTDSDLQGLLGMVGRLWHEPAPREEEDD